MRTQQKHYFGTQNWKQSRAPLRQMTYNNNLQISQDRCIAISHLYGDYKLSQPGDNNSSKSIFTQNDHLEHTRTVEEQCVQQDINDFIENSKTLRQRIYQKLSKKIKNTKKNRQIIEQTTFRPNIKKILTENNEEDGCYRCKSTRRSENNRINTQIQNGPQTWLLDNRESPKNNLLNMNFHQRQRNSQKNKENLSLKFKQQRLKQEISECTFKPKLTKYKMVRH